MSVKRSLTVSKTMIYKLLFFLFFFPLQLFAIDFVTVGNPGNAASSKGKGSVPYTYEISKYEITNMEYCLFLNAVAAESDPHSLFSSLMQEHFFGGIERKKIGDIFSYSCKSGYEHTPVVGLTWMSAVRFANWLHYNARNIELDVPISQFINQTEGDGLHGAYDTRSIPQKRNSNALYWLPNEDEWLKAAYFTGSTWNESLFPLGSNCYGDKGWAYPYPHIKPVGKSVSPSYYGTFDQQGNAAEWIENGKDGHSLWKLAKGGSLIRPASFTGFSEAEGDSPDKSIITFGLRVCRSAGKERLSSTESKFVPSVARNKKAEFCKDKQGDEYVQVMDSGNQGDVVNSFKGRVNYTYYIARTELSNKSYCKFLNAVVSHTDPYGLYNENMSTGVCGGIVRKKKGSRYVYCCKKDWENRPVVYVDYYDIARYANWMHYGCPVVERCGVGSTEGTDTQGAYNTEDFEAVRCGQKPVYDSFGKRNRGARFWIPDDDEWYKAAYYNPKKTGNRKYHDFPTQTSDAPSLADANFMAGNELSVGKPYYVAPVDSFSHAPSYYGTLQQGGNVWEWTEDWQYGVVGTRCLRGGSWSYTDYGLNACNMDPGGLDNFCHVFGARLCMSASVSGWQPVSTPIPTVIYEKMLLMPKKHFLLGLLTLSVLSLLFVACAVAKGVNLVRGIKIHR